MGKGISAAQAIDTIMDSVSPMSSTLVTFDRALGRVLADNVVARDDVPYQDNSAMDGYAVRSMDIASASPSDPVELRVIENVIFAGESLDDGSIAVSHGTAARIMTGASIPNGSDAVVPQEAVRRDGETAVFSAPAAAGSHIRFAGEDIEAGAVILTKGQEIDPAVIGMAALAGVKKLSVVRPPKVAIFTSGDELIGPGEEMKPGLVRNSNSEVLKAELAQLGCEIVDLGIARDDREDILERVAMASRADAIITSGGVSVGEKDLLREVFESEGLKVKFWGVNVKPGKPLLFGLFGGAAVFGLPGNPVSTHVCFSLFVRPALRKMQGFARTFHPLVTARLGASLRRRPGRPEYLRVRITSDDQGLVAELTRPEQSSGVFSSLLNADALLPVAPDVELISEGEIVSCIYSFGRDEEKRAGYSAAK